jgi:mannose-1-phosphate guanylyltransferase
MVLAAGLGTRLGPLTVLRAKALVPVGDRPVLGHVLDRLRASGVSRVVVNAHHRAQEVRTYATSREGGLAVSDEPELLGTAGGLAQAGPLLGPGNVLVWNADIWAEVDVRALLAAHAAAESTSRPARATLVVQPLAKGEGSVGFDAGGAVVRLRRESVGDEACGGEFLGVHVLGEALRQALPARGCLVSDVYLPALRRGERLGVLPHEGAFFDVGTLSGYMQANRAWLRARAAACWMGAGCRVAPGVVLEETVVGEGVVLGGEGRVVGSVVWPGVVATAPISNSIVTAAGVVAVSPPS